MIVPIQSVIKDAHGFLHICTGIVLNCVRTGHQANTSFGTVGDQVARDHKTAVDIVGVIGVVNELDAVLAATNNHIVPYIHLDQGRRDAGILQTYLDSIISGIQDAVVLDQERPVYIIHMDCIVACIEIDIAAVDAACADLVISQVAARMEIVKLRDELRGGLYATNTILDDKSVDDWHLRQTSANEDCSGAAHAINNGVVIDWIDLVKAFGSQSHCLVEDDVLAIYTCPDLDKIPCIGCIQC